MRPQDGRDAGVGVGLNGEGVAALFPIRVVARLTGINPVTIRAWERRYGLVSPERTPGGHRLYSRADVELLRAASRLVEQGINISRASSLLEEPIRQPACRDDALRARFLERLRALDDDGMNAIFEASQARRSAEAAAFTLLDRLPEAAGTLPALEQQFLEAWLEGLLAFRTYQRMAQPGERRVLVCSPGHRALRAWALVFALGLIGSGLRPTLLAAPDARELAEAARRTACAAIVLSGTAGEWPGVDVARLATPVFMVCAAPGVLPLGADIDEARRRVVAYLAAGRSAP
jgi:MerR family transcriptional regulator, light-induced transcriptional regulator